MVAITGTLLVQIAVFLTLVWILKRWLWGPLLGVMDERKKQIADGIAAGNRGKRELEEATENAEQALADARNQAQEILANAQRQYNENVERSRAEAREEGERIVAAAREEVDQLVVHAKEDLRREVGELAVSGAERILKREVDAKAHNDIIDDLVGQIR